jgi:hypothetical protein
MKNLEALFDINQLASNSQAGQDLFVIAMTQGKNGGTFLEIGANHCKDQSNTYLLEKVFNWSGTSIDIVNSHTATIDNFHKIVKKHWLEFYNNVKDSTWPENPRSVYDLPLFMQEEILIARRYHDYFTAEIRSAFSNLSFTWPIDRPLTNFIQHDALTLDYAFLPEKIDYLQIDIDPPIANLKVLEILLEKQTRFSIITFEHDLWRNTDEVRFVRSASRDLLARHGYEMIVNDVTIEPGKGIGIDNDPIYFEDWYAHPDEIDLEIRNYYRRVTDQLHPKYHTEILSK